MNLSFLKIEGKLKQNIASCYFFVLILLFFSSPQSSLAVAVDQATCSSYFNTTNGARYPSWGGVGTVEIKSSSSACEWSVTSDSPWITITSGRGAGDGTVQFSLTTNQDNYPRTAILSLSNGHVAVITQSGTEIYSRALVWGSAGSGDGQFNFLNGITIDQKGYIYVLDSWNKRIQKFDSSGNFITKWGSEGEGDGQFTAPQGIAVDPYGYIYVLDSENKRVQKFDSQGKFVTKWGMVSPGNGQDIPFCIAIDYEGFVYINSGGFVNDIQKGTVQKYDLSGNFLLSWEADVGIMAVDPENNIYVGSDPIVKFDSSGNVLLKFAIQSSDPARIRALSIDSSGQLYVGVLFPFNQSGFDITVEAGAVLKFDSSRLPDLRDCYGVKLLSQGDCVEWGYISTGASQFIPGGLAVDKTGFVYVADGRYSSIQKFAPIIGNQVTFRVDAVANSTANSWLDTGIDLGAGEQVTISASGRGWLSPNFYIGPDGRDLDYNGCPYGSLVAKVGDGAQFCVRSNYQLVSRESGRLYLGYNDSNFEDNFGFLSASVNVNATTKQASPLYRFYNADHGFFFYTIYDSERDFILQNLPEYQFNGIAYYAYQIQQPGTSPVYRFYDTRLGFFFYTIYDSERDFILQNLPEYQFNGIAYYGYK